MSIFSFASAQASPRDPAVGSAPDPALVMALLPVAPGLSTSDADPTIKGFETAAIGQAVAMMSEDTRTHMQGMEQIYMAATAKALAMIANPATSAQGETLLAQITTAQAATISFSLQTAAVAAAFSKI